MTTSTRARYTGYRFPAEIIGHAVWLYFRFPLGLRMVEELLAARGIIVSHETVRQWALKFGQHFANQIPGANLTRLSQKDRTGWDRINRLPAVSVNIRANSVHPGIMPPMRTSGRTADPAVRAERMRFIPMRRPGEVDEVEYTILFLASDESSYNHRFGNPTHAFDAQDGYQPRVIMRAPRNREQDPERCGPLFHIGLRRRMRDDAYFNVAEATFQRVPRRDGTSRTCSVFTFDCSQIGASRPLDDSDR